VRFRPGGYDFGTLEEIAGGSHLIVVGRIVGRASGTSDPEGFPQFGVIAVDQSLKGVPMSLDGQTILVKDLVVESISDEELPAGQVILFLKNYAQMRIDEGLPPAEDPNDTYQYFLPNRYQSFVRSVSGIVVIIDGPPGWWAQYGPFPSDFDGRPVDALLAAIESATQ
jgi:hypothetical protein